MNKKILLFILIIILFFLLAGNYNEVLLNGYWVIIDTTVDAVLHPKTYSKKQKLYKTVTQY